MYAADNQKRGMKYYNRMNGLSKRLELTLNTLASWEDVPIHFEVIHQGAVSWNPLNIWPYYEVPPTVKKYDIDLVLYMLIPTTDLGPYYAWPMTSQGIPTAKADPEYLLKPAKDRIPGGLPRKLYDLCKAKNIVTIFNNQVRFDNTQEMVQDPEILDCMTKLYSKPMRLLREKLEAPDFIPGKKVRMEICFFPLGHFQALRWLKPFFDKVLVEIGAPSLDISESFTPLRYSYYPFSEIDANDHMNTDGHMLMAFLLAHQLIREKVIPFAAPPGK